MTSCRSWGPRSTSEHLSPGMLRGCPKPKWGASISATHGASAWRDSIRHRECRGQMAPGMSCTTRNCCGCRPLQNVLLTSSMSKRGSECQTGWTFLRQDAATLPNKHTLKLFQNPSVHVGSLLQSVYPSSWEKKKHLRNSAKLTKHWNIWNPHFLTIPNSLLLSNSNMKWALRLASIWAPRLAFTTEDSQRCVRFLAGKSWQIMRNLPSKWVLPASKLA